MYYGNTYREVIPFLIGSVIWAILVILIGAGGVSAGIGKLSFNVLVGLIICSLMLFPIVLIVIVSTWFSVRVTNDLIQHLFLKRFVLNEKRLEELVSVAIRPDGYSAILRFQDGSKIRFLMGHLGEMGRMAEGLCKMTNGRVIKDF